MKVNLSRLAKLETEVKEHRRQKKKRPTIDFSTFTDQELTDYYDQYLIDHPFPVTNEYDGMTDQQLGELYVQQIRDGNAKNNKKVK